MVAVVDADRHVLADAWRLPVGSRKRLQRLSRPHFEACQDIEFALARLLGDHRSMRAWLHQRHVGFFHARPIDVALGSYPGCLQVRRLLLAEVAAADPLDGIAATAMGTPP